MEYKDTTDIPTDLVKVVIAFAAQSGKLMEWREIVNR